MSYKDKKISVIIPAAGMGKRMNSKISKQFIEINNKPILAYTLEKFEKSDCIDEIILVLREDEIDYTKKYIIKKYKLNKIEKIAIGGKERQDSVYNGLKKVSDITEIVLVHDGARPFLKENTIERAIECAIDTGACVVGVPVKDTIKIINKDNIINDTPDRKTLWAVQTPQVFSKDLLIRAHEDAVDKRISCTDDSMLIERLGFKVKMILGDYENIKITTPEDIKFAQVLFD